MNEYYILYGNETNTIYLSASTRGDLHKKAMQNFPNHDREDNPVYPEAMRILHATKK